MDSTTQDESCKN